MSSEALYIYLQRPDNGEWVTVGRYTLDRAGAAGSFRYAPLYLEQGLPWSIDPVNLRLTGQADYPAHRYRGLSDVLRDICPDAWGRSLLQREHGLPDSSHDLDYLRLAGNGDRWGALAVGSGKRPSPAHIAIPKLARLGELLDELLCMAQQQPPRHPALRRQLLRSPSMGGARPKATVQDGEQYWLAKPTLVSDAQPVALLEYTCMQLASACGIDTAATQLHRDGVRDTVLVQRFDRSGTQRHMVVSAASLLQTEYPAGTPANQARWSYSRLAQVLRQIGAPESDLQQLFRRMLFNALIGNDDDHPRNHAVIWRQAGQRWRLSPAFDIVPAAGDAPRTLAMQLSNGRFDICREAMLADARFFGLSMQAAEAELQLMTKQLRVVGDKQTNQLPPEWQDWLSSRIRQQLLLLA